MKTTSFFIACCFIAAGASGQAPQFERLSVEHGLSQSSVNDIIQDRHGFLWIGTQDGLNRYDGYHFQVWSSQPGDSLALSADFAKTLLEGDDGRLWVGTQGGGLNVLDPETGHFRSWTPENSPLPNANVTDLAQLGSSIWVATLGGLVRYHPETDSMKVYPVGRMRQGARVRAQVLSLAVDDSGRIWVGSDLGGLQLLGTQTDSLSRVPLTEAPEGGPQDVILSLFPEPGVLWVGTAGAGLFRLDTTTMEAVSFAAPPDAPASVGRIQTILRTSDGVLRVGTDGAGLGIVDETSRTMRLVTSNPSNDGSLPHNTVHALFEDATGSLWAGTQGGGLARQLRFDWVSTQTQPALASRTVYNLFEDSEGSIWVATDGAGVQRIDPTSGEVTTWSTVSQPGSRLSNDRVISLMLDEDDSIWAGTAGGLNRIDRATGLVEIMRGVTSDSTTLSDNRVFAIEPSRVDPTSIWIGTWGGLNRLDRATRKVERLYHRPIDSTSIGSNSVLSVLEDSRGRLWVGTMGGGLAMRKPSGTEIELQQQPGSAGFRRFQADSADSTSLSDNLVFTVFEASDGTIWVGTANGLNRFEEESGTFTVFSERDGLPNNTIASIEEDLQGRLWLGTNNGLVARLPESGQYVTFNVTDGAQSNEFNHAAVYRAPDGHMLFGGIDGFNRFDPERVIAQSTPRAVITSLSTSARTFAPTQVAALDEIRLTPEDGTITVEFATTDFRNPNRMRYAYRLAGEDDVWQERTADQRFVSWPRLRGGDYTLMIRVMGPEGIWSESARTLDIHVVPPITERAWFLAFMGLLVLGVLGGTGYAWHIQRLGALERRRQEEQEVHRRLMEGREAERLHLSQELHDGVVQDLYGIRFTTQADGNDPLDNNVQEVIVKLRQICGELRPPVLAPFGLERTIRSHADEFRDRNPSIEVNLDLDEDGQQIPEVMRLVFFRVYQESMNNVVRHAQATRVDVEFRFDGTSASLQVADNGKGFDLPTSWLELGRKDHFGLLGVSERVRAVGGDLHVESSPGKGVQIRITVRDVHRVVVV